MKEQFQGMVEMTTSLSLLSVHIIVTSWTLGIKAQVELFPPSPEMSFSSSDVLVVTWTYSVVTQWPPTSCHLCFCETSPLWVWRAYGSSLSGEAPVDPSLLSETFLDHMTGKWLGSQSPLAWWRTLCLAEGLSKARECATLPANRQHIANTLGVMATGKLILPTLHYVYACSGGYWWVYQFRTTIKKLKNIHI